MASTLARRRTLRWPPENSPAMALHIPFADLVTILQACPARRRDCTPNLLRTLVALRLDEIAPQLADRVRAFTIDEMMAVCEYVLAGLELAEGPPAGRR
jgi:hypothetical protein